MLLLLMEDSSGTKHNWVSPTYDHGYNLRKPIFYSDNLNQLISCRLTLRQRRKCTNRIPCTTTSDSGRLNILLTSMVFSFIFLAFSSGCIGGSCGLSWYEGMKNSCVSLASVSFYFLLVLYDERMSRHKKKSSSDSERLRSAPDQKADPPTFTTLHGHITVYSKESVN